VPCSFTAEMLLFLFLLLLLLLLQMLLMIIIIMMMMTTVTKVFLGVGTYFGIADIIGFKLTFAITDPT
jgi:hypothetical protein